MTVEEIKDAIETYNTLIVRLPIDTYHNKLASRHIFLDWKTFVDTSLDKLVEKGMLTKSEDEKHGYGSDQTPGIDNPYSYTEYYYTNEDGNEVPLVDYSYLYDKDGNQILDEETRKPIGDRWDYWTEGDFLEISD